ncbi:MAG: M48 family metalloprotease [Blastocatellia bacterium]|nr:M48 family metalloprotease [Blastocatellia bacterium]
MKNWLWVLAAVVCCSIYGFADGTDSPYNPSPKEIRKADRLLADYADEVWYAREWLMVNNDVTRIVEILNAMQEPDAEQVEQSFQSAMKVTFPNSRRMPDLEPAVARKMERFLEYYHLQGKIHLRVFTLNFPMAFNSGQVVGVSDTLLMNWSDEELMGVVAHEIGHIIAQVQDRLSEQTAPEGRAYERAEEIKADWVAMMMFRGAGMEPETVVMGLERIVPRTEWKRAGPQHPPMAIRSAMMREWLMLPPQRPRLHDALLQSSRPALDFAGQKSSIEK